MRTLLAPCVCLLIGCSSPGGETPPAGTGGGTQTAAGGGGAGGATAGGTGGSSTAGGVSSATGGGSSIGTGGGAGSGTAGGCVAPTASNPTLPSPAQLLIVTRASREAAFRQLAALHTVTGVPAEVLTLERLCSQRTCNDADPKNDTAKALKAEVTARPGLKYVLLGGPPSEVPGRRVQDSYSNPLAPSFTYGADYESDYYYSDLSEWDSDGDGQYAEKSGDAPDLLPELAVTRLPLRSDADVAAYVEKVRRHLTAYPSAQADKVVLVSNVAIELDLGGLPVKVDSAYWFSSPGRTLAVLPQGAAVTKLYATTAVDPQAQPSTTASQRAALQAGPNIVVHSGHASAASLMSEPDGTQSFSGADARVLMNSSYPFFFSSGCEAANSMAPLGAGEQLIAAPSGGAIAYLGNVPVGLGIAGGMQLIDETLRHVRAHPNALIGDAYLAGHQNLPTTDSFQVPGLSLSVPVLDQSSWRWTQKGAELFGDPAVPVWTTPLPQAPSLTATVTEACGQATLTVQLGAPATGTLRVLAGGKLFQATLSAQRTASFELTQKPERAVLGLVAAGTQPGYASVMF